MRVKGTGPVPCDIAFIGEGPGWEEDRDGTPFVGKTGDELDRHLEINQLPRVRAYQAFASNIYREYGGKDYKWTAADFERDWPELVRELRRVHPRLIVTLGRHATRCFLGDVDMDGTQGLPWVYPRLHPDLDAALPSDVVIFPIVHPAAGMHNPEMSPYVVHGFQQLARYFAGKLAAKVLYDDPIKETHYEEVTTESRLLHVTRDWTETTIVGIDTEGWPDRPWSLQFSALAGTGYLTRASAHELLDAFGGVVYRRRPRLVFHSALHDLGMGRALQTSFDGLTFDDTMVMAYLLQIEPQGLKAGALRHCNMRMHEYTEIIGDRANALARDYLTWVWDAEMADYEDRQHDAFAVEIAKGRHIKVLPKLPKSALLKAVERVLSSKRPADLWEEQVIDLQVAAYHRVGALPRATLDYVDRQTAVDYGCRDADATVRLYHEYGPRLDEMGLRSVYELELATYPLLDRMQRVGIKPDLDQFASLSSALTIEIARLQETLDGLAWDGFNANSGDQVAQFLFEILGLEEIKFTKGGRGSTNDLILEALENEHPECYQQVSSVRQYREFYKLKHTFVDRIPDYVHRWPFDGRIHTTLRTTRVVTGRLAAADPNLLAQPEHGEWAEHFQRGWVAEDGHELAAWDESQIELRGLAHLSRDPVLLAVYRGELRNADGSLIDLHAKLAQRIFGGDVKDYTEGTRRLAAKAINFGIPMGMTAKGLSVQLRKNGINADEDTAQRWLDETLGLYQGVKQYMKDRIEEASRNGYVRCLSGRIRYIGGVRSRNERVREEAERFAFSTPIQESAQFIMKQAEVRVWTEVLPYFWNKGVYCEPLLQVHDCLKLEVDSRYTVDLNLLMNDAMTKVPKGFCVPLTAVGKHGPTFADVKKFK